jgi:hypothetical protein
MEGASEPKRARLWPHTPDIFATFVSLPIRPSAGLISLQKALIVSARAAWGCVVTPCEDLHVSLTVTLPLARKDRARLTQRISSVISSSNVCSFVAETSSITVLTNESGATSFIALVVEADELNELTSRLDKELVLLGQPSLPDPPVFHISLAWADGDWSADDHVSVVRAHGLDLLEDCSLKVCECVLRVGDLLHSFSLPVSKN